MASIKLFGNHRGNPVYIIKLTNGEIEAEIISFGATLRALRVQDYKGKFRDVCLGYDSIEEYAANDGYLGASVGRFANRISNSRFILNEKEIILDPNEGPNQLHGGPEGFSHRLWSFSCTENSVCFSLESPDSDQGFPGSLKVSVTYTIEGKSLLIDYFAVSDADTVVNLTNHTYFNLSGHDSGDIRSHTLRLAAEQYTPCAHANIPTGDISSIAGTALDFTDERAVGTALDALSETDTKGLDHNFVISGIPGAILYSPESGIEMSCSSSLEGMQVYSAGFLSERIGKYGAKYYPHQGICLETQHYPDAVNKPHFPSPILKADEEYRHWTKFSFSLR